MKKEDKTKLDIEKKCKSWGIVVIIGGLLTMYFSNMIVGAIILFIGVVTIILRKDWNLAVIGTLIILLGGVRLIDVIVYDFFGMMYGLFSIILIVGGVYALVKYYKTGATNIKKNILIVITILSLVILVGTFISEGKISFEEAMMENYGEFFTGNDTYYNEYALNVGLEDGTYTIEHVYEVLDELEKNINESEAIMLEASKYSLLTYVRWSSLSERNEYTTIYPESYRSSINMERNLIEAGVFTNKCLDTTGCENGWCKVEGTEYCCPRRNMEIVNGRCSQKI